MLLVSLDLTYDLFKTEIIEITKEASRFIVNGKELKCIFAPFASSPKLIVAGIASK